MILPIKFNEQIFNLFLDKIHIRLFVEQFALDLNKNYLIIHNLRNNTYLSITKNVNKLGEILASRQKFVNFVMAFYKNKKPRKLKMN